MWTNSCYRNKFYFAFIGKTLFAFNRDFIVIMYQETLVSVDIYGGLLLSLTSYKLADNS